jgi:HNH endonuclease
MNICKQCKNSFPQPYEVSYSRYLGMRFCSTKCANKHTAQQRYKKNSVTFNCERCGKSKKQKLAIYKKCKRHFCSTGCANKFNAQFHKATNHHNWKGGITEENHKIRTSAEYIEWRLKVFQRDRFTCINCGYRSKGQGTKDIIADHIKPFSLHPELRFEVSNGRTLCRSCDTLLGWNYKKETALMRIDTL